VLRHVSPAFGEDPLRVLRAARFMARFAGLGFTVAPGDDGADAGMVASGELAELTPERVWQELRRAIASPRRPRSCARCTTAARWRWCCRKSRRLYGVPQRAEHHPEVDTGVHIELVCDMAARLAPGDELIGFAALTHDLGKALTPGIAAAACRPRKRGLAPLRALCERLKVPLEHRQLCRVRVSEHLNVHRFDELRASTVVELIARCDGFAGPAASPSSPSRAKPTSVAAPGLPISTTRPGSCCARACRGAGSSRVRLAGELQGPELGEALRKAARRRRGRDDRQETVSHRVRTPRIRWCRKKKTPGNPAFSLMPVGRRSEAEIHLA
jgi:tRNA nucleotidyltransferase (CCA-adding enzyme)